MADLSWLGLGESATLIVGDAMTEGRIGVEEDDIEALRRELERYAVSMDLDEETMAVMLFLLTNQILDELGIEVEEAQELTH